MALLDISLVTKALVNLIKASVMEKLVLSGTDFDVLPVPPDKLTEKSLGFHLYHVTEDTHYKNLPVPGNDVPSVRYVPMALSLYYQLTAHWTTLLDVEGNTYMEQKMMGCAVKALHDYPIIDDSTKVGGDQDENKIFPGDLQNSNNKLRIVLQPISHNDSVSFWTAGETRPQLSAYYQVSVVLLEPEEIQFRFGRVLEYGVHTFIGGAPRIESSRNTLLFPTPGGEERNVNLHPAQVPVGGQIAFTGSGFTGDSTLLLLKNPRWDKPVEADPAWNVIVSAGRVTAEVQETISGVAIFPGVYSAIIRVTKNSALSDGSMQTFEHTSNECPFTITPRIVTINTIDNIVWTVTGYAFMDANPPSTGSRIKEVQVYVSDTRLTLITAGSLNEGEFEITNANELRFRPQALDPGNYPVRIFVNGAESPPRWIEIASP